MKVPFSDEKTTNGVNIDHIKSYNQDFLAKLSNGKTVLISCHCSTLANMKRNDTHNVTAITFQSGLFSIDDISRSDVFYMSIYSWIFILHVKCFAVPIQIQRNDLVHPVLEDRWPMKPHKCYFAPSPPLRR